MALWHEEMDKRLLFDLKDKLAQDKKYKTLWKGEKHQSIKIVLFEFRLNHILKCVNSVQVCFTFSKVCEFCT